MVMKILKEIIEKLGLENVEELEYFDLSEDKRKELVSMIWDEVYGEEYIKSYLPMTPQNPLEVQFDIISYLMDILHENEQKGEYEVCDIVLQLIQISEHKMEIIDKIYANTK
jgi:hypothetical protein